MMRRLLLFVFTLSIATLLATSTQGASAQQPDFAAAIAAQDHATPGLLARPGIVGTGVGVNAQGEPVIRIFVETPGVGAPPSIDNVPVERVVTGRIDAQCHSTTDRCRPSPIGISAGHPNITAGTIGARVEGSNGTLYALSNNHVFANSNNASVGDNILQPGPYDGGTNPADQVGDLAAFVPINFSGANNTVDAAIATILNDGNGNPMVLNSTPANGYGTPSSSILACQNDACANLLTQSVKKYGRTTGLTTGAIAEVNVTVNVCYASRGPFCTQLATFVDQLTVGSGTFSAGGDSGSLIVTNDGANRPVGLLFAGSSTRTIANRIDFVLSAFSITIDDSTGGGGGDDTTPPAAPTGLDAVAGSSSRVDLTWNANSELDFDHYVIYRDGNPVGQSDTNSFSNTGLDANTEYTYQVSAFDTSGNESPLSGSASATTLSPPPPAPITLTASGFKVRGVQSANLTWSGATSTNVDIYRNGVPIVTSTGNDGAHTDNIGSRGGGSYTYQVCEAGTNTCSNEATIVF